MDEDSRILTDVQAKNSAVVNEADGRVTLTNLPITGEEDNKPTLHGLFRNPVSIGALQITLLSPSSSSTPESVDLPEVVPVEIAFFTTSARDTDIDTPSNEVDAEPKVMRICNVSKMKDRP